MENNQSIYFIVIYHFHGHAKTTSQKWLTVAIWLTWTIMDYHGLSWTIMDYYGLSWIIMDYPRLDFNNLGTYGLTYLQTDIGTC